MSDHSLSYLVWKCSHHNDLPRTIQYRNFRKVVKEDFKNQPWKTIVSYFDLDEAVYINGKSFCWRWLINICQLEKRELGKTHLHG